MSSHWTRQRTSAREQQCRRARARFNEGRLMADTRKPVPSADAGPAPAEAEETNGAMRIDPDFVRELAELLTANELTEIEVADGNRRIKVSRDLPPVIGASTPALPMAAAAEHSVAPAPSDAEKAAVEEVAGTAVKSPMVGTAFLSAQP